MCYIHDHGYTQLYTVIHVVLLVQVVGLAGHSGVIVRALVPVVPGPDNVCARQETHSVMEMDSSLENAFARSLIVMVMTQCVQCD